MDLTDKQLAARYPSMVPAQTPGRDAPQADHTPEDAALRRAYPSMFPAANAAGKSAPTNAEAAQAKDREAWRTASLAEFSPEALESARQVVKECGDEDLRVLLGRGLGDHPAMVRLLAQVGARLRQGSQGRGE